MSLKGFATLRDMTDADGVIDKSRLAMKGHLGEGAFAVVTRALLDGVRPVAVKQLKPALLEDPVELKLFLHEMRLLRKLRHPSIVELIGVGSEARLETDGSRDGHSMDMYLVQELCTGGTLRDLIFRQMTISSGVLYSLADALRWVTDVARALHYLHSRSPRVMHRDIKLENILLTDTSVAKASAKLSDFGLAKLMRSNKRAKQRLTQIRSLLAVPSETLDAADQQRLQKVNSALMQVDSMASCCNEPFVAGSDSYRWTDMTTQTGSYAYMAPEVLRGEPYDEKADIFR